MSETMLELRRVSKGFGYKPTGNLRSKARLRGILKGLGYKLERVVRDLGDSCRHSEIDQDVCYARIPAPQATFRVHSHLRPFFHLCFYERGGDAASHSTGQGQPGKRHIQGSGPTEPAWRNPPCDPSLDDGPLGERRTRTQTRRLEQLSVKRVSWVVLRGAHGSQENQACWGSGRQCRRHGRMRLTVRVRSIRF